MNPQKKVLIIEDDPDLVEAMSVILHSRGLQTVSAYAPEEGYEIATEVNPDLIILDVMFEKQGDTRGFEYARKFRQDKKLAGIPILMETAVNSEHPGFHFSADDGEYLPVDAFINKPMQPDELIAKTEQLLAQGVSKWSNWPASA